MVPSPSACACCGGKLSKLGEDITETLEVIPRQWKVVQTVRERFSCRSCEVITQPPAPFHPISRGRAGPHLLAMILEAKFGQHLPLNRQSESYAREGIELSVSTIADWVGTCTAMLAPLVRLIDAHALTAARLHGDDTTVPLLARDKTIIARVWTYVRDDRPFGGPAPPAAMFRYSRDRTGSVGLDASKGAYAGRCQGHIAGPLHRTRRQAAFRPNGVSCTQGRSLACPNPRKPAKQRGAPSGGEHGSYGNWRRGWDLNPRYACTYFGFRDRRDRPLCHLSAAGRRARTGARDAL